MKNLLYDSKALTAEEEQLRAALLDWCQARFDEGARPVPLYAALMIVTDLVKAANTSGFTMSGKLTGWKP